MATTLDDLYHMVAHIYGERNAERPASTTFAHFVEVCGMLTIHTREKVREDVSVEGALCKALGWYFPLMAKFNVVSVEELIFRKYPYACPYCRLCPHKAEQCKEIVGSKTVDHADLERVFRENEHRRPKSLDQWREMFGAIYQRDPGDRGRGRSVIGLFEELGELAEAIRVFDRYPKYLAGEAADVFSYLMGLANEHVLVERTAGRTFSFEQSFIRRYPGLCVQCGYQICVCPVIPEATVGRLAKELELHGRPIFAANAISAERANAVARSVLDNLGGYSEIARQFPFDRGDANRSLVLLCVQVADKVATEKPEAAKRLREAALAIGKSTTQAGSKLHSDTVVDAIVSLRSVWPLLDSVAGNDSSLAVMLGELLRDASVQSSKIGIVTALPKEFAAVRAMFEDSRDFPVPGDPNDYVIGAIPAKNGSGMHLVVLTLLKKMGNNSAATSATNLLRSFPQVRDVLMVGIAAGAPSPDKPETHVRLGDIVVSSEKGVLQYDNIKLEQQSVEIRGDSPPPSALMTGKVKMLEAGRLAAQRPWEQYIDRGTALEDGQRPPVTSDRLADATGGMVEHPKETSRREGYPKVISGRIGSANTLLKNPLVRDLLRDKAEMRAFEMEGSGIADGSWTFGQAYMLIRGICDYGDMTKINEWQGYAAAVAAAYCRALIESIPVEVA